MSLWRKHVVTMSKHVVYVKNTCCQCEKNMLSLWGKHVVFERNTCCHCEVNMLSLWGKHVVSVRKTCCLCEENMLSLWGKHVATVRNTCCHCEEYMLPLWGKHVLTAGKTCCHLNECMLSLGGNMWSLWEKNVVTDILNTFMILKSTFDLVRSFLIMSLTNLYICNKYLRKSIKISYAKTHNFGTICLEKVWIFFFLIYIQYTYNIHF